MDKETWKILAIGCLGLLLVLVRHIYINDKYNTEKQLSETKLEIKNTQKELKAISKKLERISIR